MAERIYIIDLSVDGQNRYRHRHVLEKDQIVEFSVQYETMLRANGILLYGTIALMALRTVI